MFIRAIPFIKVDISGQETLSLYMLVHHPVKVNFLIDFNTHSVVVNSVTVVY